MEMILLRILVVCIVGVNSLKLVKTPPETSWVRAGENLSLTCASDIPWNICIFTSLTHKIEATATSGKSPKSEELPFTKFKNDNYSCVLEIQSAKTEYHNGPWTCHLAYSREENSHKDDAFFDVQVATKFSPEIYIRNPETLSVIDLDNEVHLNTTLSIECSSKGNKTSKPPPNLSIYIKTKEGFKQELTTSSFGSHSFSVNYTLDKADAESRFYCESIQVIPDPGPDMQGGLILYKEDEKSDKIDLIYKPIFEAYRNSYIYKDGPVDIEVKFYSRPSPFSVVWLDHNNVDLVDPTRFIHYDYATDPDQHDIHRANLRVHNLTEETWVKLLVKNDVGQEDAVIEIKVEGTNPVSVPAVDAANVGQIPIWIIILTVFTVLLIVGLLGFGLCKVKKNKEAKSTQDKEMNEDVEEPKDNETDKLNREAQSEKEVIVETQNNYLQGSSNIEDENEKPNEDLAPASVDETDKVERNEDAHPLIGFSDDEDAFFNEKDLDVPEDPNFRKSIEEMTLMPDILTIETSTARKIKATNSLPRAPTRLRTPLSPTSNIMTSGPTSYPILVPQEDRVFFGPHTSFPGRKTPQLDLLTSTDLSQRSLRVSVNDTDL